MEKVIKQILVLNGPNLNMLGLREQEHYGTASLDDIEKSVKEIVDKNGFSVEFKQSNNEGEIVSWIQQSINNSSGLIINAGAYTHTSIAIFDALKIIDIPIIEVHLSNIYAREHFRKTSLISELATGIICGFGKLSYELAIQAMITNIQKTGKKINE
ncbi:MAG: 3-dehydroquinate dehydratase [Alphaproteobacteria bacterium MarineAlpha2_Bin1]|nr:MAG: 3-dehydroquinate dehydratase [Alphaproteobacteria bacterium MarineAlpha2_Bin1]|tara:strand:- start:886 stop:1356 length:471 start_codon:yes stop_codon:yes gene_type:complete